MSQSSVLVVGHYCHDTLFHAQGGSSEALGGSVAYVSSILDALKIHYSVVSKVGSDFAYFNQVSRPPKIIPHFPTTQFIADFTQGERQGKVGAICDAIYPEDLPEDGKYELGLAVGIVGEVLPQTLEKLSEKARYVLCDVQGLIRELDSKGKVKNRKLEDTPFYSLLGKIAYLKASRLEAESMDLETIRYLTCVLVTEGAEGCTVYRGDQEFRIPAFRVREVDPTGAGDCFLAGFTAGLLRGLPLERAVLMGNYFGGLAVSQVGVPQLKDFSTVISDDFNS